MAVISDQTSENYVPGRYHRINKIEFLCFPVEPNHPAPPEPQLVVHVGFYVSQEARNGNPQNPPWTNVVVFRDSELPFNLRELAYDMLMKSPLFAGTDAIPDNGAPVAPSILPVTAGTVQGS